MKNTWSRTRKPKLLSKCIFCYCQIVNNYMITVSQLMEEYSLLFVEWLIYYLRYFYVLALSGGQHILCCFFYFVCLRLVCPMLQVSLDCPFLIAPLLFSNVYSNVHRRHIPVVTIYTVSHLMWKDVNFTQVTVYVLYLLMAKDLLNVTVYTVSHLMAKNTLQM